MRTLFSRKTVAGLTVAALLLLGGGIALAATSHAAESSGQSVSHATGDSISIQATYIDGNPALVANFSPNGGLAKPRWSICPPSVGACTPASSRSQFLTPGPTPAGTVFEASATYRGKTYTRRTSPWLGTVHSTEPPTVTGSARYGSVVAPHAGSWTGGWKTEPHAAGPPADFGAGRSPNANALNIEACRTRAATHCINLTPQGNAPIFSNHHPKIGQWYTGWYIFAFDQLEAADTAYAGVGYINAASMPVVKIGPTAARSAPYGPISGPTPPDVHIYRHLHSTDGQIAIATVRCTFRCQVRAEALGRRGGSGGDAHPVGEAQISVAQGHLSPGPVKVTLFVGDGPSVHRTATLR